MKIKESFEILGIVYKKKSYFYITAIIGILAFFTLYYLTLSNIANKSFKIFLMMTGENYSFSTFLTFVIISLLFGIFLSIAVYKFNLIKKANQKNKKGTLTSITGFLGFFAGVFGAGCPTCGSVVFALFGAPLALMYLPFKGAELRILSIFILLVSIHLILQSLIKCDVGINNKH